MSAISRPNMKPGHAQARVSLVDGMSSLVSQQAHTPAKLLAPVARGPAVWLCHLSFGGGVVAGDHLDMSLKLDACTSALLSTQGATKVYTTAHALGSSQRTFAELDTGAFLAHIPHPITAYANSDYMQESLFHCQSGASCCWWECLSAGRLDQGEHWSSKRVRLSTTLQVDDRIVLRDRQCLEGECMRKQLQPWHCSFSLGLYGPRCQDAIEALSANSGSSPDCQVSASPFAEGLLLRGLAREVESARSYCRQACHWLSGILGEDPWARLL